MENTAAFDRTNTGTWTEGNVGTWEVHCARTEEGERHFTAANGECLSCTYYSGVTTRTEYLAQFSDDALAAMCGYGYHNYATGLTETATLEEIIAVRKHRADRDAAWLRNNPQAEIEDFTEGPGNLVTSVTLRVFGGASHNDRVAAATDYLEMMTDIGHRVSVEHYETTAKETESGYRFTEFRYF